MVMLLSDNQDEILVPLKELLSLQDAHITGADLVQRALNEAQVTSLRMADPASWPKIVLTRTDIGLVIIDGYHRREAARRRKHTEILASIRAFTTEDEVIEAAFQANIGHGLPASATTRSDYAYWLFRVHPDLKQNEIARRVGVKPSTVNTAIKRRERERKAAEAEQQRRAMSAWSKEALRESDFKDARDKEIAQTIRAYVRQSKRLYKQLRRLDDDGERYWALEEAMNEGDTMILARVCQYVEHYLKDNLPPELLKSLKPTATCRTKKAPDPDAQENQDH